MYLPSAQEPVAVCGSRFFWFRVGRTPPVPLLQTDSESQMIVSRTGAFVRFVGVTL
jgi:hypothetical protein